MSEDLRVYIINRESKLWLGLIKLQRIILFLTSVFIIAIVSAGAIMRYVFKIDFYGVEDITLMISFVMYFIGGMYASYEKSHVSAMVIPLLMKDKKKRNILIIIKSLLTVALSWVFTVWGFMMVKWGIVAKGVTPTLGIPLIIPKGTIFVGLFFMSFYFTVYAIEEILNYKKNNYTDLLIEEEVL